MYPTLLYIVHLLSNKPFPFRVRYSFSSALIIYAVLQNSNLLIVKLDGLLIGTLNQLTTLVLAVSKVLINEVFNV